MKSLLHVTSHRWFLKTVTVSAVTVLFLAFPPRSLAQRAVRHAIPASQVPRLIEEMNSTDRARRCNAVAALDYTETPDQVKKHLSTLLRLSRSGDDCVKGAAIETVSKLAPESEEGFESALQLLSSSNSDHHWRAANAIIEFACRSKAPQRFARVKEYYLKYKTRREANTRLLQAASCFGDKALPLVMAELNSSDPRLQAEAIQLITRLSGSAAKPEAKKEIIAALKNLSPAKENEAILKANLPLVEQEVR